MDKCENHLVNMIETKVYFIWTYQCWLDDFNSQGPKVKVIDKWEAVQGILHLYFIPLRIQSAYM